MTDDESEMIWTVQLCEKFGWTFEHVRQMPLDDLMIIMGYMEGMSKLDEYRAQKNAQRQGRRRR